MTTVAQKIENLRRLKEQCERRARLLRARGEHCAANDMERSALGIYWSMSNIEAAEALAAFAERVEG